jgi:serine/threonine-protein kinase
LVVGQTLAGRYEIERELGRGGTAIVYLARDTSQGRMVAIKTLKPELVETLIGPRFLREIRLTTALHDPHIVPLLDSGQADGLLYCVMPFMDGGTLRDRLAQERPLPLNEAVLIARTIAGALESAHSKGLIHRDVKPANILFVGGQACLGDFGIARAIARGSGDDDTSTTAGIVRGTPAYMSPEQAAGNQHYDGRSDIYSLGCVLYEMIAGVQPYVGPSAESLLSQRMVHSPRPLEMYRPSVPRELAEVVERALMIAPADRYQTAGEFEAALASAEPLLPHGRTTSHRLPAAGDVLRIKRRRWLIGATLVALATIAGVIGRIVTRSPPGPPSASDVPEGDPRRIAVMYLDDLTPSLVPTYVADGITEDLIDQLGAVRGLRVISPDGVRPFRRNAVPVDSIARALKVGTIISGSIARYGMTLRVIVRLVDAATGQQLDTRAIEENWTEVLTLQDSLAGDVAVSLRQRLGEEIDMRGDRAATKSYAAWEAVQLGNDAYSRGRAAAMVVSDDARSTALFLLSDSMFARAGALDHNWVRPTVRRGRVALALAFQSPVPPNRADSVVYRHLPPAEKRIVWIRRAIQLADDAVARDRSSADGLVLRADALVELMRAGVPARDSLAALTEHDLRAALESRPNMARAWSTLAELARARGQFAEAADAAKHGFGADAFFEVSAIVQTGFSASLNASEFGDAEHWCRVGLARYPGDPRFTECQLTLLGWTAGTRDDATKAWRLIEDIERRDTLHILAQTWGYRRLMAAAILARAGLADSARHLLTAVRAASPRRTTPSSEAYVQLLVGDRDGALASLSAAVAATPVLRPQIANTAMFQTLHNDPRFIALTQGTP